MESNENNLPSTSSLIELTDWIWYEIPQEKNHPTHRQLHTGVIYRDEWFIFGGFAKDQPLDELWTLSLVTKEWRQLKRSLRSWPKPRHSHTATLRSYISKTGRSVESMIIFGGVTENGETLNDVWEYSFKKSNWNKLETTGDIPPSRWGHSAVIFQNELWIFGGFNNAWNSDLYCLSLGSLKWRKVNSEGSPSARHFHSADVYNDKMYIFGGLSNKNLGDLKSFHFGIIDFQYFHSILPATEKWENVEAINSISPRRGHQSIIFDHYLIVHGGRNNIEASNDLNFFDFDTNTWETIKVDATAPTPRYFHSVCFWQNAIVVFGGLGVVRNNPPLDKNGKIKNRNLNDLYCYSFKGNVFTDINAINGIFSVMPLDILKYFLEYLDMTSLARISKVNRFFYFLSSADYLWSRCVTLKIKQDSWLANSSMLKEIETGYAARKNTPVSNNNNNNAAVISNGTHCVSYTDFSSAVRLDDLLALMQSKMKPDITQFYWKHQYVERIICRNGYSWKPQRDQFRVEMGFGHFEAATHDMKLVVVGGGGVGKSATVIQFISNHFVDEYDPTIEDSYRKQVKLPGRDTSALLDILDTAGPEDYSVMREQYMRSGGGFIIMYALTSRSSFDEVTGFIEQICRVKDYDPHDIPLVLVANKCDLESERQITKEEGREMAQRYDIPYFEASAKLRVNTDQQFLELMKEVAYKVYAKSTNAAHKKKEKCILQ